MMISPEMFVELHKDKKYGDLLSVRTIGRISDFMWCYNPFRQITLNKDVGINGAV